MDEDDIDILYFVYLCHIRQRFDLDRFYINKFLIYLRSYYFEFKCVIFLLIIIILNFNELFVITC